MDVEGVHTVEAPCRRVHSPMEDSYSPSWNVCSRVSLHSVLTVLLSF